LRRSRAPQHEQPEGEADTGLPARVHRGYHPFRSVCDAMQKMGEEEDGRQCRQNATLSQVRADQAYFFIGSVLRSMVSTDKSAMEHSEHVLRRK
jgi:hypothetical protein